MPAKPVAPAKTDEASAVDVEVLPPERAGRGPAGNPRDALPRLIALLLDNLVKLPGTKRRIGLNPVLDLLPLLGEAGNGAAALVSSVLIFEGARRGLPRIVLARMAGNVLLNGLVGTIPFVGSAFSFWFRASLRNLGLLQAHTSAAFAAGGAARRSTAGDWAFVLVLVAGVLVLIGLFVSVSLYVSYEIFKTLFGG